MYLDLYPREGKYGHAAVWGLIPGWTDPKAGRQYPVACMVANLSKKTAGGPPPVMRHDDAVTFAHELGHAFHGLCSKTQYGRFHGTAVSRDFVSAGSLPTTRGSFPRGLQMSPADSRSEALSA